MEPAKTGTDIPVEIDRAGCDRQCVRGGDAAQVQRRPALRLGPNGAAVPAAPGWQHCPGLLPDVWPVCGLVRAVYVDAGHPERVHQLQGRVDHDLSGGRHNPPEPDGAGCACGGGQLFRQHRRDHLHDHHRHGSPVSAVLHPERCHNQPGRQKAAAQHLVRGVRSGRNRRAVDFRFLPDAAGDCGFPRRWLPRIGAQCHIG
uniref:(northern house mosquito) hypothetical protein n=2 Tax=Culex pipiens TaxID=7175 RepID=A0A8D8CAG2_CULPI